MQHIVRSITFGLAAFALLALSSGHAHAQASQAKGSLSGTVLTKDGKPANGLVVRLERMRPVAMEEPGGRKGKSSGIGSDARGLQNKGGKKGGMEIIGKATTDAAGKFTISNLEPGGATLVAGGQKIGWIYTEVEIEPGKDTNIGEVRLQPLD